MKLLEILETSAEDLPKIREDDLIGESARIPVLFSKWHRIFRELRMEKILLNKEIRKTSKEAWEYYSGNASDEVYKKKPFGLRLQNKTVIQTYVDADPDLEKLNDRLEIIEEKEKTLVDILYQINQRQWHIRNMNESKKFFNGDN